MIVPGGLSHIVGTAQPIIFDDSIDGDSLSPFT